MGGARDGDGDGGDAAARPRRLQEELDAADARLRLVAQNFSLEWKAFLSYAMQIKQSAAFASFPEKQALEDLLLQSQSGLVMLREMKARRDAKWSRLMHWRKPHRQVEREPSQRPRSRSQASDAGENEDEGCCDPLHAAFSARFQNYTRRRVRFCYAELARRQLTPVGAANSEFQSPMAFEASVNVKRQVTKQLQSGLAQLQMLAAHQSEVGGCPLGSIQTECLDAYLRYECARQKYTVSLHRFLMRMRWLTHSHRYHIRQRMLEVCYQQQARVAPLSPAALLEKMKTAAYASSRGNGNGAQCPLCPVRRQQVENELLECLNCLGLRHVFQRHAHPIAVRLRVEEVFDAVVQATRIDEESASKTSSAASSLVSSVIVRGRWSLLQMTGAVEESNIRSDATREQQNAAAIIADDVLLRNELELLRVDDNGYIKARLEAQANAHWERAIVSVEALSHIQISSTKDEAARGPAEVAARDMLGFGGEAVAPELITAFYSARYLACRRKRQKLLRQLTYLHYLAQSRHDQEEELASKMASVGNPRAKHEPSTFAKSNWSVERRAGYDGEDIVVHCDGVEFVSSDAMRDLDVLESELLHFTSLFINKQQREVLLQSSSDSRLQAFLAIDRAQVMSELYDCEVKFHSAKINLILELHALRHRYTDNSASDGDHVMELLRSRPLIDASHAYVTESYANEVRILELRARLLGEIRVRVLESQKQESNGQVEGHWLDDSLVLHQYVSRILLEEMNTLKRAESMWFIGASVSEYHALKQAYYEKLVALWKNVVVFDMLPDSETCSLGTSSETILQGKGWKASLSSSLVANAVSAASNSGAVGTTSSVSSCSSGHAVTVTAVEVLRWRRKLGVQVYETHVLETLYGIQLQFVDVLQSRRIDDPGLFFENEHHSAGCQLTPILHHLYGSARAKPGQASKRSTTTGDWFGVVLRAYSDPQLRSECAHTFETQQAYKRCLIDIVRFNDALTREVVEFAATSPFFVMASSLANRRQEGAGEAAAAEVMASINLKTVKWKHMDDIVERIREVVSSTCAPLWLPFEALQARMSEATQQYTSSYVLPTEVEDAEADISIISDAGLCKHLCDFFHSLTRTQRLLIEFDDILRTLHNEKKLMDGIFPNDPEERCAFHVHQPADAGASDGSFSTTHVLSQWLTQKLTQIKADTRSTKASDALVRDSRLRRRLSVQRNSFMDTGAEAISALASPDTDNPPGHGPTTDDIKLILELPTTEQLIRWYAPSSQGDQMADDQSMASLSALVEIFSQFASAMRTLRTETSLGFYLNSTRAERNIRRQRTRRRDHSAVNFSPLFSIASPLVSVGVEMLRDWQIAFHRAIKMFNDRLVEKFEHHASTARDLFAVYNDEEAHKRHQQLLFRQAVGRAIEELHAEYRSRVSCAATAVVIEATGLMPADHLRAERQAIFEVVGGQGSEELLLLRLSTVASSAQLNDFFKLLCKTHDRNELDAISEWLDIVYSYVCQRTDQPEQVPHTLEAIREYNELAERYNMFDSALHSGTLDEESASQEWESIAEETHPSDERCVSGTSLGMRTPDVLKVQSNTGSTCRNPVLGSPLLCILAIVRGLSNKVFHSRERGSVQPGTIDQILLQLPTRARVSLHKEILRVHLDIRWLEDDICRMQSHYEHFLIHRRKFDLHQSQTECNAGPSTVHCTTRSPQSILLEFSPYYRDENEGQFIVPACQMPLLLTAFVTRIQFLNEEMRVGDAQLTSDFERRNNLLTSELERQSEALASHLRDEALKRESYAVDRTYELQFHLQKQRQEMDLLQSRLALEQQQLKAELMVDFERRVSEMHVQMATRQQQFDNDQHMMQHDLKQQLRGAQNHLVQQLVDQSGTMSIETKTSFLESLHGQAAQDHLQEENVRLRQTLVKLQGVYEAQHQTREAQAERERVQLETHRLREAQLESENTLLRHQLRKLEEQVARISQDRALHQIKLANLQKQHEESAQKRREEKVRALSAPYRRGAVFATKDSDEEVLDVQQGSRRRKMEKGPPDDYEQQQEQFEREHESRIRRISAPQREAVDAEESKTRFDNAARHYQNEIRRLQQQLAREVKQKTVLMDQLAELRSRVGQCEMSNQADESPESSSRLLGSYDEASPRQRAVSSASVASPRRPPPSIVIPKRPSTSFASPRVRSAAPSPRSTTIACASPGVVQRLGSGIVTPSSTTHRKFEVVPRDPANDAKIRGIAGVQNALSARERLPYR